MDEEQNYSDTGNLYEQMEQDLCKRCQKRRIDRSENPQSVLCKECREELIRLKVPPGMIAAGAGVIALVVISVLAFGVKFISDSGLGNYHYTSKEFPTGADTAAEAQDNTLESNYLLSKESRAAREKANQGYVVTAMDELLDYLETHTDDLGAAIMLSDIAMEYSYPDYAAYAIDNYLVEQTVSDEEYDRITAYIDQLNIYYDTSDLADSLWSAVNETGSEDYIAVYQEYHDGLSAYLGNSQYDQALLNYNLSYACLDEAERIEHLENCIKLDENYLDACAQLGVYYRRAGELERARQLLEKGYQKNKEDYSLLRALATLELAEENSEQGVAYATEAYQLYPDGDYVADTYIVALIANGKAEEAEALTKELEDSGYIFDDDFYAYLKGDMTLQEYYIGSDEEVEE